MLGYNLFLYCGNNPVRFSDDEGTFWDIAIDVVFTIGSVINVIQNPTSGKAWAALGLDLICMVVPFVSGAGTALRAASKVDDVVDAGRAPLVKYSANDKYYPMELHHKIPRCEGGTHDIENLLPVTPWVHDQIDIHRHFNPK